MIRVSGTLTVTRRNGRNGSFNVGDLATEIGAFRVKDQIIEQFEEGRYEGEFAISQIYPSCYVWGGKAVAEIRASLADIALVDAQEEAQPETPTEPDPIDELPSPAPRNEVEAEPAPPAETPSSDDPLVAMFGAELAPQVTVRAAIKLDPTVDRDKFRAQRDELKRLGYKFDAKSQTWVAG